MAEKDNFHMIPGDNEDLRVSRHSFNQRSTRALQTTLNLILVKHGTYMFV